MIILSIDLTDDSIRRQHRNGMQMVSEMIKKYTGIETAAVDYTITDSGKPCLKNIPDIDFSVMHYKQFSICALSFPCKKIPADTELINSGFSVDKPGDYCFEADGKVKSVGVFMKKIENKNLKRLQCVANRYFCDADRDMLSESFSYRKFYEIWTKKESFEVMKSIDLSNDDTNPAYANALYKSVSFSDGGNEYCISICYE